MIVPVYIYINPYTSSTLYNVICIANRWLVPTCMHNYGMLVRAVCTSYIICIFTFYDTTQKSYKPEHISFDYFVSHNMIYFRLGRPIAEVFKPLDNKPRRNPCYNPKALQFMCVVFHHKIITNFVSRCDKGRETSLVLTLIGKFV